MDKFNLQIYCYFKADFLSLRIYHDLQINFLSITNTNQLSKDENSILRFGADHNQSTTLAINKLNCKQLSLTLFILPTVKHSDKT